MDKSVLKPADLKPGDIFLCVFEHPGAEAYFEALINTIKYYNYKDEADRTKFLENALIILRGLIITFDDDIYTHASFWNGEAIVEAGLSGVNANPLEHYKDTITDVYRFQKDGNELGSNELPNTPLLEEAQKLVDQNLNYSYETAYLYILLCLTRWKRDEWITLMKDSLKAQLSENKSSYIELIFNIYHDKIVMLFEWMADEMIRQIVAYRKDDGLVCSETVAKIYNEALPIGNYHIEKPLSADSNPPIRSKQQDGEPIGEHILDTFIESLKELEKNDIYSVGSYSWGNAVDIEYTPHDLARSKNTYLAGRLDLT